MADTSLDCDRAEDRIDGAPQRLAAVEEHEHALLAVGAAVDQVGQQHPRDGRSARRSPVRNGSEAEQVTLGGRRVPVDRPRVRATDGCGEVQMAT